MTDFTASEFDAAADDLLAQNRPNERAVAMLRACAAERRARDRAAEGVQLVWTGPFRDAPNARATSVVVDDLLASASRSVLVSTFVIHQGAVLFEPLRRAWEANPALRVRLFLNIARPRDDRRSAEELVRCCADDFPRHWPWPRRPEVYFDPRSLETDGFATPSLHAKCIVVDDRRALVTSANLTEAAQERNLELGVLLDDPVTVVEIRRIFDSLVARERVRRLPGF